MLEDIRASMLVILVLLGTLILYWVQIQ